MNITRRSNSPLQRLFSESPWGASILSSVFDRMDDDGDRAWLIPVDMLSGDKEVTVKASLPGVAADDINITVDGRLLTIKVEVSSDESVDDGDYLLRERSVGKFQRVVRLPHKVDREKAQSSYKDGVLEITLPVSVDESPHRIAVK